jgi:hypothetical protein
VTIEARPVEVSKPAVDPGIYAVALLEPVKEGDAEAVPAPIAEPPGTGVSVAPAVLVGERELYCVLAPAWAKAELVKAVR